MKVKKFVAPTMPEAMNKIRKELGSDAVILNSRKVKSSGFLGLLKKVNIEVMAVHDPDAAEPKRQIAPDPNPLRLQSEDLESEQDVLKEIKQLKQLIKQQAPETSSRYTSAYQSIYKHLLDQEVESALAQDITDQVVSQQKDEEPEMQMIKQAVTLEIAKRLYQYPFQRISYHKQVIHFVGPTGVGKTTTLAKVAAEAIVRDNKKVAFITTDTYRIAAVDQLKTYAHILDVPLEVAYTAEDYQAAINKFKAYDAILVDTAGRNYREDKYMSELTKMTNNQDAETYLVLSLTAKSADITEVAERFRKLAVHKVIFTKLDETAQYGSMLNIVLNNSAGIAYITNGQGVPEDLLEASPEKISHLVMGGMQYV